MNFLIAGPAVTRLGLPLDPAIPLTDTKLGTVTGVLGFARVIKVGGQSAKFSVVQAYSWLDGTGKFNGEPVSRTVNGLTIDAGALAKPLLLTILIPMVIGVLIRHYALTVSERIFPTVKKIAGLTTLLTIVFCLVLYGKGMLDTAGSFALLSMTIFMIGMGLISYRFGFGLKTAERSVMALGMGTRNIAAVLAGALAIPDADPRIVVMVIMWTLWSVVLAWGAAPILAKMARSSDSN